MPAAMARQRTVLLQNMFSISRPRKSLSQLLRQLAGDGARVAEAELAQARTELGELVRGLLLGFFIGASAVAVLIVTVGMLAHGAALALTPYMPSVVYAYFSVGLVLAIMTAILILIAYRCLVKKREPVGLIFKWFADVANAPKPQP